MQASKESTPFEYLLSIDRRCVEHQGGLVQQVADSKFSHGLAFNLGAHQYIVPIADINEVIAISNYTSIPRSQGWLTGISNIRGNLVTLLDLHNIIFDTSSTADLQSKRALLVKQDSNYYGLVIDSIIGMKSYQSDKASDQVPDGFDPNYIGHISAFYQSGEEWFAALSILNLLQDERFKQLSKIS